MAERRKSLLDKAREKNFLRESFGVRGISKEDYVLLLIREYEQWRKLYKTTQKLSSKKNFNIVVKKDDVKNLSKDDELFLQNRPDYLAITLNARNYCELVVYWSKIASNYENMHIKSIDEIQDKRQSIINDLLMEENEICTICNNGFCMKDIHYLIGQDADFDALPDINTLNLSDSATDASN